MRDWNQSLGESGGRRYVETRMAVVIAANGGFGESVLLEGKDAERFVDEIENPSMDARRLEHLERSDQTFKDVFSPEPIGKLPTE